MKSEASVVIQRPAEEVFPYLEDPDKIKLWMEQFVSSSRAGDAEPHAGMKFRDVFKQPGGGTREAEGELLVYEPPARMKLRSDDKSFAVVIDFTLDETPDGTRVTQKVEASARSPLFRVMMSVLGPLFGRMAVRQLRKDLEKLKNTVEGA